MLYYSHKILKSLLKDPICFIPLQMNGMYLKEIAELVASDVPYLKISASLPNSDTALLSQSTVSN